MGIEKGGASGSDKIRVLFTFGKSLTNYAEAIHHLEEAEDCIRQMIDPLGFTAGDLKTTRICMEKDSYKVHGARRELGYIYSHKMKLEFDADQERLRKLLDVLAECPIKPEFEVIYITGESENQGNHCPYCPGVCYG